MQKYQTLMAVLEASSKKERGGGGDEGRERGC